MRIFVFEYVTGGGMLDAELSPSLAREGDLMLRALASDLGAVPGVDCLITRDARLDPLELRLESRSVATVEEFPEVWESALRSVDAVWPIAPESADALALISEQVLAAGKVLLNSPPAAVRVATSKRQTLRLLEAAGVQVVPTFGADDVLPDIKGAWVLKPDDGVGCMGIRLFRDREDLCGAWALDQGGCTLVAQPFLQGTAASLSLIVRAGEASVLSVNRQRVAMMDDGLVLLGCVVNGLATQAAAFQAVADRVAKALPGLWGYVGVDLIVNAEGLWVLEVNPRLTTSYVGLREALGINPAGLVLDLQTGARLPRREAYDGRPVEICLEYAGVA